MEDVGFGSPEEAALGDWPPSAQVRVVSVVVSGNRAQVVLDTEPSYPCWVYCIQDPDGWREVVSGNGPCDGWNDPKLIQWE